MPSARPLLPRLLLAMFSGLVALGLVEAGFRMSGYKGLEDLTDGRELAIRPSADEELVYELTPGAKGRLWDCAVSINSGGFRDQEYPRDKPAGVIRILALGDSITFGNGLQVDRTWSSFLQANLNKRSPLAEVLNFGVGGYDLAQEVRFLERSGLSYDPDYVVLAYCVNDLATVSVNLETIARLEQHRTGLLAWSRAAQWLQLRMDSKELASGMQDQRDAELLRLTAARITQDAVVDSLIVQIQSALDATPPGTEIAERSLRERLGWYTSQGRIQRVREGFDKLAGLAAEHEFSVALFVVPYLEEAQFEEAWGAAYAIVRHLAEAAGFQVLDVRSEMAKLGLSSLKMSARDSIHPMSSGHRAMARVVLRHCNSWKGLRPRDRKKDK